ncbi:MAG TPA: hypothetical protein VK338_00820, partial [Candidatus Nitrosocosmicus sp.]|nr:hypothetical protein [Candidatus Nitrosocosmicus sp.]
MSLASGEASLAPPPFEAARFYGPEMTDQKRVSKAIQRSFLDLQARPDTQDLLTRKGTITSELSTIQTYDATKSAFDALRAQPDVQRVTADRANILASGSPADKALLANYDAQEAAFNAMDTNADVQDARSRSATIQAEHNKIVQYDTMKATFDEVMKGNLGPDKHLDVTPALAFIDSELAANTTALAGATTPEDTARIQSKIDELTAYKNTLELQSAEVDPVTHKRELTTPAEAVVIPPDFQTQLDEMFEAAKTDKKSMKETFKILAMGRASQAAEAQIGKLTRKLTKQVANGDLDQTEMDDILEQQTNALRTWAENQEKQLQSEIQRMKERGKTPEDKALGYDLDIHLQQFQYSENQDRIAELHQKAVAGPLNEEDTHELNKLENKQIELDDSIRQMETERAGIVDKNGNEIEDKVAAFAVGLVEDTASDEDKMEAKKNT